MNRKLHFHIGLRTAKTAAAVIISMMLVDTYGTSSSKLIFAMLGAMAAVQPTFKESVRSSLTQIVGVLLGAVMSVVLLRVPLPRIAITGIGIILVITLYNAMRLHFSPSLPCFIVVMLCTTPDIRPIPYALGRIWDSAIGLGVGMLVNMLVFPYDNSRRIRRTAEGLDKELIRFLEDLFDGDDVLPDAEEMEAAVGEMDSQLRIFADQKLLLRLRRQSRELQSFRLVEGKARVLVAHMEVLCHMQYPGRLNEENRRCLTACGANIRDRRPIDLGLEHDVVTNYHISRILVLRRELLNALKEKPL